MEGLRGELFSVAEFMAINPKGNRRRITLLEAAFVAPYCSQKDPAQDAGMKYKAMLLQDEGEDEN